MNTFESEWVEIDSDRVLISNTNYKVTFNSYIKSGRPDADGNLKIKCKIKLENVRLSSLSPASVKMVEAGSPPSGLIVDLGTMSSASVPVYYDFPEQIEIDKGKTVEYESEWLSSISKEDEDSTIMIDSYPYFKIYSVRQNIDYFIGDGTSAHYQSEDIYTDDPQQVSAHQAIKTVYFPKPAYVSSSVPSYLNVETLYDAKFTDYVYPNTYDHKYFVVLTCNDQIIYNEDVTRDFRDDGWGMHHSKGITFNQTLCMESSPNSTTPKGHLSIQTVFEVGSQKYVYEYDKPITIYLWKQSEGPNSLAPSIRDFSITVTNPEPATPKLDARGIKLRKTSMVNINIDAVASTGASIARCDIQIWQNEQHSDYSIHTYYSTSIQDRILDYVGYNEFDIMVYDSRGSWVKLDPVTFNDVDDFTHPTMSDNSKAYRSDTDGTENQDGDYISFYINGSISAFQYGEIDNEAHALFRFLDGGEYSPWRSINVGQVFTIACSKLYYSTNVQICFRDDSGIEITDTFTLIKGSPVMNLRPDGLGVSFGKLSDKKECVDSEWTYIAPSFEVSKKNADKTDHNNQDLIRPNRMYQNSDTYGSVINSGSTYDSVRIDISEPGSYCIIGSCSLTFRSRHANVNAQIVVDSDDDTVLYSLSYPTISRAATRLLSSGIESSNEVRSGATCSGFLKLSSGVAKVKLRITNDSDDKVDSYSNLIIFRLDGLTDSF